MQETLKIATSDEDLKPLDPPISYLSARQQLAVAMGKLLVPNASTTIFKFRLPSSHLRDVRNYVQSMRVYLSRARGQLIDDSRPMRRFRTFTDLHVDPKSKTTLVVLEIVMFGGKRINAGQSTELDIIANTIAEDNNNVDN